MKNIFISLIFLCFSFPALSSDLGSLKVFKRLDFPFPDITYMEIISGKYKTDYSDYDMMDIVDACDEYNNYEIEGDNVGSYLRLSICTAFRTQLSEVLDENY